MTVRACWALVPVKPLALAKSRLAGALLGPARRQLARDLLDHTLDVLLACPLAGVAVVTRDPEVVALAGTRGALALPETAVELATLIDGALAALAARGADAVIVVLADLPELTTADVADMVDLGGRHGVVLAPDATDEGTNALLLAPPGRMATCFGRHGSFGAHRERAAALGLDAAVLRSPSLAFDLDTVADLERLAARHPDRGPGLPPADVPTRDTRPR